LRSAKDILVLLKLPISSFTEPTQEVMSDPPSDQTRFGTVAFALPLCGAENDVSEVGVRGAWDEDA